MEEVTFDEIIARMENATDYSELYEAASLIANDSLRVDVEQLIGECEDDGDAVEVAYSVVTSDLLDSHANEENVATLEEGKIIEDTFHKTNQIKSFQELEVSTFEELKEQMERLAEEEVIDDDEYDIFMDIIDNRETECANYIEERSKVTNTDYEDELGIEEDNVKATIEEIIDSIKTVNENKKIEEGKDLSVENIKRWLKEIVDDLVKSEEGCGEYKLDNDLSIFCGWSGGYDAEDKSDDIHSKNDPTFCINVGIKSNHDYMKTDYDWLVAPYDKKSGEVWDTDLTVSKNGLSDADIQWLIDQYTEIRKEVDAGNLLLENKKEEGCTKKVEESNAGKSLYDWLEEKKFDASIDVVDNEHDMMVAFDFNPEEADKDPFDSYMAMLARQLKVLDDGNDIITVNMTDYVTRNFDLLDALFDVNADSKEDEIAQLVCDIMPSVMSGYTTDSIYTELLNSSKKVESKKLTEGAGAGYTVKGKINYDSINIKSFNIVSDENDVAEVDCDIDAKLDDVTFESYYYGDRVEEADVHISHITLDKQYLEPEDEDINETTIRDALDGLTVDPLIGGGWTHTTFDGELDCDENHTDGNSYSTLTVIGAQMDIVDTNLIDFINKAVQGENIVTEYSVWKDDDMLESFDNEDSAIEYAKEKGADKVQTSNFRYDFYENWEDLDDDEVIWTSDELDESKKIEEKTSFDDFKDYCNDLSIDYKKSSSLNKYLKDLADNEAKMNGISEITNKINQARKEIKAGLKESKKVEEAKKIEENQVKDKSLFEEVMSYLYGEYIKDNYDLGDDEDLLNDITRYTYLGSLVNLPKDEEDMENEEILQVPAVKELLSRIRTEADKLADVETYEGELELSHRGVLSDITNEEMYNKLGDEGFLNWYWQEADAALEEFAENHGIDKNDISYSGRGARHILIPATYENASRYQELKADFEQFQNEFVERINNYVDEE